MPSYSCINQRLTEIEEGEFVAETLDCITSRKQELQNDSDDATITWTATGEPLLKKHKIRGRLLLTTEEFRLWMRIMRHHWGVVRVRHSDKPALAGLNAEFWENYTEYMLSEECRGYGVKDEEQEWKHRSRGEHS